MAEPWYAAAFGAHYPLLYAHRDGEEAADLLALLARMLPHGLPADGPVLDLGCGDGRHLRRLRRTHPRAFGLDLSAPLLARARLDDAELPLLRGDMRRLPLATASCGAVLSLFTAFGYFGPPQDHGPCFAEIARVLRPGGLWVLDYLDAETVARELDAGAAERVREVGPLAVSEWRELDGGRRTVRKRVQLRPRPGAEAEAAEWGIDAVGLDYTEEVALFAFDELLGMAGEAGLSLTASAGSYAGTPLGSGDRWILGFVRDTAPGGGAA